MPCGDGRPDREYQGDGVQAARIAEPRVEDRGGTDNHENRDRRRIAHDEGDAAHCQKHDGQRVEGARGHTGADQQRRATELGEAHRCRQHEIQGRRSDQAPHARMRHRTTLRRSASTVVSSRMYVPYSVGGIERRRCFVIAVSIWYGRCHPEADDLTGVGRDPRTLTHRRLPPVDQEELTMTLATGTQRPAANRESFELQLARWLASYSIDALRASLGMIFLGFGVLKFVPGLSPAEGLAAATLEILTFGLVPERLGMIAVAGLESTIGLLLLTGLAPRVALALLGVALVGILSPIVLLPGQMFAESRIAPTLTGQYVLKDIVLVAAGLVIAARALGARLVVAAGQEGVR